MISILAIALSSVSMGFSILTLRCLMEMKKRGGQEMTGLWNHIVELGNDVLTIKKVVENKQ